MENDLLKTLKLVGLCKQFSVVQTNAFEDNKSLKYGLKSVAKTFAKYYSNLVESLLKNLPNSPNKFDINSVHQYYKNIELKDNVNLNLTTEKKVLEVLPFIDISEAAAIDKISGRFLEDGANILAKPIAKICNISISSGLFPSDCKIAKLEQLHKKGSKTNEKILKGFDKGIFTGMILIDLQKVFDTRNHENLLGKLHAIGFSEKTVAWFKSYLSDRATSQIYIKFFETSSRIYFRPTSIFTIC